MQLNKQEQLLFLECLKAHATEGFYLLGHYGFTGDRGDACKMGKRLCRSLDIPPKGRAWIGTQWG